MGIGKQKTNDKNGSGKRPKRFRLTFANETTNAELWTVKMSQSRVVLSVAGIALSVVCVVTTLIVFTPIRTLLPGYLKMSQRQENIVNSMMLDSLSTRVSINNAYLANLTDILTDNVEAEPMTVVNDTAVRLIPVDSIMGASEAERQFVRQFDEEERYNLSVLSPLVAEGMLFYAPVSGAEVDTESLDGLTLIVPSLSPVSAVYNGTVVDCYYNATEGSVVIIQHPNDFISKYIGVGEAFCDKGTKVVTGQRIGIIGGRYKGPSRFRFELWHRGSALQPQDYIAF